MATNIDICNIALVAVGADKISVFDNSSAESIAASEAYEPYLAAALCRYPWRWCCKQEKLTKLTAAPVARWAAAYQMPSGMLELRAVLDSRGEPVVFDTIDDRVVTDETGDLWAEFTFRPNESAFPPHFVIAFAKVLEGVFCDSLLSDKKRSQATLQEAEEVYWPRAQTGAAKARTSRRIARSRLVAVRQ